MGTSCGWQENRVVGLGIVEQIKGGGKVGVEFNP